ncbi:hypothetical protein IP88_01175 [alpha proteobacterium AAP81b]|nr:hypothetical protein IP88_01175 [alpha proteobacterium AAP81b]
MRPASDRLALHLVRAVAAEAGVALAGEKPVLIVEELTAHDWASATFQGALHRLDLRLEGPADLVAQACDRLQTGLSTRDIPLPGHFVAEIALTLGNLIHNDAVFVYQTLTVNALVIAD